MMERNLPLLVIFILFAIVAATIRLDPSLPDGIYSAHMDDNNPGKLLVRRHDVHEETDHAHGQPHSSCPPDGCRIVSGISRLYLSRYLKEELPIPKGKTFCHTGGNYTTSDYHAAINGLFSTPLFWAPPYVARFALHGSAVAYLCTFAGWNVGSLVEFMDAMDYLDKQCGFNVAAKLTLPRWDKFYGRQARGADICQYEKERGGVANELAEAVASGCHDFVSGISRVLGDPGPCNSNAAGPSFWRNIKKAFSWYTLPAEDGTAMPPDGK